MSPSNKPLLEQCQVCSVSCHTFCASCKKAYYCCVDHQRSDRKQHKKNCFPARLELSAAFGGRCFVSTRPIKPGELIFKDTALLAGPSGAEVYFHIICLGCYRSVKGSYKCSSCGWPVCSQRCEKMPHHANNECKIFRNAQVEPCVIKPYQYDFINFLRSLLLRDHANNSSGENIHGGLLQQYKECWEAILSLEPHSEARAKNSFGSRLLRETVQFVQKTCKLEERFESKLIDHIVGVWGINSFGANPPAGVKPGYARMATLLFPKLCLAAHNCIPNTHGVLKEDSQNGNLIYTMELIASLPIPEGAQIHTTYANVCEGTVERREVLQDHYFFACSCERCSSPTEFGTFFSALKCASCSSGFLLPEDPLDKNGAWMCSKSCTKSMQDRVRYSEFVPKINRIRREINAAEMEHGVVDCIGKYQEILDTYKGKVLHPNHWLVIDIEFKLIQRMVSYLNRAKKEEQSEMLKQLIELAQHCLDIADVLQPGLNSYRGKILFCLVEGKLKQLILNTQNHGINDILKTERLMEMKEQAEQAISIMAREQCCEEKQVAAMLIQDVRTIEQMLEVTNKQAKAGVVKS